MSQGSNLALYGSDGTNTRAALKAAISTCLGLGENNSYSPIFGTNQAKTNVYSSSLQEINPSGNAATLTSGGGGTATFTLQSDVDAVSDMFLEIKTANLGATAQCLPHGLTKQIKKIEFKVGGQTVQHINAEDIISHAQSEMTSSNYEAFYMQSSGGMTADGASQSLTVVSGAVHTTASPAGVNVAATIPLPCFTRSVKPAFPSLPDSGESGAFLCLLAPSQKVEVKVHLNKLSDGFRDSNSGADLASAHLELKLHAKCLTASSSEARCLKSLPQVTKLSPYSLSVNVKNVELSAGETTHQMQLDTITNYSTHLLLKLTNPLVRVQSVVLTGNSTPENELPGLLLESPAAAALGLHYNETVIEGVKQDGQLCIVPLAGLAYGSGGVSTHNYDTIRLDVNLSAPAAAQTDINVTAVGFCLITYGRGSAKADLS